MQVLVLLLVAAWPCIGEESAGTPQPEPTPEDRRWQGWFPMGGLKYDSVTGITGAGCICLIIGDPSTHPREGAVVIAEPHLIIQLEAGQGGGKLQVGVGAWYMAGGVAKLSLLRTWGDPMEIEPSQTYLGAELQLNIFPLNGAVGVYGEIDGDGEDVTLVTWSAGIGF